MKTSSLLFFGIAEPFVSPCYTDWNYITNESNICSLPKLHTFWESSGSRRGSCDTCSKLNRHPPQGNWNSQFLDRMSDLVTPLNLNIKDLLTQRSWWILQTFWALVQKLTPWNEACTAKVLKRLSGFFIFVSKNLIEAFHNNRNITSALILYIKNIANLQFTLFLHFVINLKSQE